jgi:hypothetical protein
VEPTHDDRTIVLAGDRDELNEIAWQLRQQSGRHARGEGPAPTTEDARAWADALEQAREEEEPPPCA